MDAKRRTPDSTMLCNIICTRFGTIVCTMVCTMVGTMVGTVGVFHYVECTTLCNVICTIFGTWFGHASNIANFNLKDFRFGFP